MTKVEALKNLYEALGGTPADVADMGTVTELLNATSALYEGEAAETIADAIDNLAQVVDTSPETYLVTLTTEEDEPYVADKTYAEIMAAINGGKLVKFKLIWPEGEGYANGYYLFIDSEDPTADAIINIVTSSEVREAPDSRKVTQMIMLTSDNVTAPLEMIELPD